MNGLNITDLPTERHYCRKANNDFWLDWTKGRIESFVNRFEDNFCLIFYQDAPPYDYYAVPYSVIKSKEIDSHMHAKRNRWNGSIDNHFLIIRKAPLESIKIDVTKYYNNYQDDFSQLTGMESRQSVNRHSLQNLPLGLSPNGETFHQRSNSPDGWLYVITNPSWPDWVKIGVTRDLSARLSTYNTGSPYPEVDYRFFSYIFHENARFIEKEIHTSLSDLTGNSHSNEWYRMKPDDAYSMVVRACQ